MLTYAHAITPAQAMHELEELAQAAAVSAGLFGLMGKRARRVLRTQVARPRSSAADIFQYQPQVGWGLPWSVFLAVYVVLCMSVSARCVPVILVVLAWWIGTT